MFQVACSSPYLEGTSLFSCIFSPPFMFLSASTFLSIVHAILCFPLLPVMWKALYNKDHKMGPRLDKGSLGTSGHPGNVLGHPGQYFLEVSWPAGQQSKMRWLRMGFGGSLGGSVVRNSPANAGDLSVTPDQGRSHMPQSS